KIKKSNDAITIELIKNKDILKEVGAKKSNHQILIGFALETNNELENAQKKLIEKNADYILLNSLKDPNAGFNKDTNKIIILHKNKKDNHIIELNSKKKVAEEIAAYIIHENFSNE
ncbi:phosphopantothenoylcysteine decarboxylase, partial [Bacillus pumilus]|uniref:phosphopantothenoylcysteine decarboxylase domain-containing protein n=1 Tax=Bacillus pumilus TaxID=1408 RepID=UPI00331565F1